MTASIIDCTESYICAPTPTLNYIESTSTISIDENHFAISHDMTAPSFQNSNLLGNRNLKENFGTFPIIDKIGFETSPTHYIDPVPKSDANQMVGAKSHLSKSQAIAMRLKKKSTRSEHWEPKVGNVNKDLEITRKGNLRTDAEMSAIKDVKNLSRKSRKQVKKQMHKMNNMLSKLSIKDQRFLKYYDEENGLHSWVRTECGDCHDGMVSFPIEPTGISYPRCWNFFTTNQGHILHIRDNISLTNIVGPIDDLDKDCVRNDEGGIYYSRNGYMYVLIFNIVSEQFFLSPVPCPHCSVEGPYDSDDSDEDDILSGIDYKKQIDESGEKPFGPTVSSILSDLHIRALSPRKNPLTKAAKFFSMSTLMKFFDSVNKLTSTGQDNSFWLQFVEILHDFILTIHTLFKASGAVDYYKAIYFFVSKHTRATFESSIVVSLCSTTVIKGLKAIADAFYKESVSAEGMSDSVEYIRSLLSTAFKSEAALAVKQIFLGILSFKIFPKKIAMSIFSVIGTPSKATFLELLDDIMSSFVKILRFSECVYDGMPIHEALLSENPKATHMNSSFKLLQYKDLLYSGMPVEGRMRESEFLIQCKREIDFFEPMHKTMNTSTKEGKEMYLRYFALKAALDSVRLGSARLKRVAPIGVILVGQPGIGKSHILNLLMKIFSDVMGREYDESLLYTRIQGSDYWEGYDPASHPYIKYTEAGSIHRNIASRSGDPQLTEFVSLIDGQPYPVNMAFADKGKIFAKPELVIADTNTQDLNLPWIVNNAAAVRRRFIYVEPRVKAEFATSTGAIDKSKCNDDRYQLDRWHFNVYEELPIDAKTSARKMHISGGDVYELQTWFAERVKYHFDSESEILESMRQTLKKKLPSNHEEYEKSKLAPPVEESQVILEDVTEEYFSALKDEAGASADEKSYPLSSFETWEPLSDQKESYISSEVGDNLQDEKSMFDILDEKGYTIVYKKDVLPEDGFQFENYPNFSKLMSYFFCAENAFLYTLWFQQFIWTVSPYANQFCNIIKSFLYFLFQLLIIAFSFFVLIFNIDIYGWIATYMHVLDIKDSFEDVMNNKPDRHGYRVKRRVMISRMKDSFFFRWNKFLYHIGLAKTHYVANAKLYSILFGCARTAMFITVIVTAAKFFKERPKTQGGSINRQVELDDEKEVSEERQILSPKLRDPEMFDVVDLNEFERSVNVGVGFVRVPNKVATTWNTLNTCHTSKIKTSTELSGLRASVIANTRYCSVYKDGSTWYTHIFGLKNSYAIVPTHCLRDNYYGAKLMVSISGGTLNNDKFHITILDRTNTLDLGNDMTLLNLSSIHFQNCLKFVAQDIIYPDSIPCISHENVSSFGSFVSGQLANHKGSFIHYKNLISYSYPGHKGGDCGKALISKKDRGYSISGMHVAGHDFNDIGYALCLVQRDLSSAIDVISTQSSLMQVSSESSVKMELGMPSSKSPFRYEDLSGIEFYGTLSGNVMLNSKSKLVKTKIYDIIPTIFEKACGFVMDKQFCPPAMRPFSIDGKYFSPYNIALVNMAKQKKALDQELLTFIVEEITDRIVQKLRERGHTTWSPLTMHMAINGSSDDKFMRRITASTSAGYGFTGSKGKYMPLIPDSDDRAANQELKDKLAIMATRYMRDETNFCIYKAHLKDEPRDVEKVKQGKTRVFYASSLDNLILSRMFLAPYYTTMVEHSDIFCTCVGIDMHTQADELYNDLVDFSSYHMEGDYGKFDQSMPFDISRASCSVVHNVLRRMGYNESALRIVRGILSDSLFPIVNMNNDILCNPGMQPSGKYATAEDNGMKGLFLLAYAWYKMVGRDVPFFENNLPKTYGDDVLNSVNPKYAHIFNNITYAAFVSENYGMEYTSAAKDGTLTEFVKADKMSFLKRKFKYSDDFGKIVAPLDMNSIIKAFMWTLPSDFVSEEEQIFATTMSMLRELAFCVSPIEHEEIRIAICDALIANYHLDPIRVNRDLKTFDRLRRDILSKDTTETYIEELSGDED